MPCFIGGAPVEAAFDRSKGSADLMQAGAFCKCQTFPEREARRRLEAIVLPDVDLVGSVVSFASVGESPVQNAGKPIETPAVSAAHRSSIGTMVEGASNSSHHAREATERAR